MENPWKSLSARDLVFIILAGLIVIWWIRPTVEGVFNNDSGECRIRFAHIDEAYAIDRHQLTERQRRIIDGRLQGLRSQVLDLIGNVHLGTDIPEEVKMIGTDSYEWTIPSNKMSRFLSGDLSSLARSVAAAASCYYTNELFIHEGMRPYQVNMRLQDESGNSLGRLIRGRWNRS